MLTRKSLLNIPDSGIWNDLRFFSLMALYCALMVLAYFSGNAFSLYAIVLLPFISLGAYFLIFRQSYFALFILFILPFSINIRDAGFGFGISLPAEPMIAILGVVFLFQLVLEGKYPLDIVRHPMSILLAFHIAWNLITSLSSTMPLVSFKFVAIRILYIVVFYGYFGLLFRNNQIRNKFLYLYGASLIAVIIYSIVQLYHTQNFGEYYYTCEPFFADHTIYSACICLLLPLNLIVAFYPGQFKLSLNYKIIFILSSVLLLAGLVFSYSRAAWLSMTITACFYVILRLKLKFTTFICLLILLAGFFYFYQNDLGNRIGQTREVSQQSLLKHAVSMTNVKTDVSNTERLNRWSCAYRMFLARPIFGFGPGTYQFQYNPFQKVSEMTYISTHHGDKGEAHSEYLKPLSESGLLGFLSQLSIVLATIFYGMKIIYTSKYKQVKLFATGILLGLMTFFIHGFMNFFLDTDKFSALYWGMLAMLVTLDIQSRSKEKDEKTT